MIRKMKNEIEIPKEKNNTEFGDEINNVKKRTEIVKQQNQGKYF